MTNTWTKIKDYIKSLELDWSDFFLAIGFIFSVPFYAFAWKFMVETDLSKIFLTNWMIIICFSVTAICWGIYFYLEIKRGRLKNNIFLWAAILLAIIALVGVLVQPETVRLTIHEVVGSGLDVVLGSGVLKVGDGLVQALEEIVVDVLARVALGSLDTGNIGLAVGNIAPEVNQVHVDMSPEDAADGCIDCIAFGVAVLDEGVAVLDGEAVCLAPGVSKGGITG